MAVTSERIIGRQLTVTADGSRTIWDSINATETFNSEDATASDSELDEIVQTTKVLSGEVSGFQGVANNAGNLPQIGDVLSDFDVKSGSDSLLPTLGAFTNIKVTDVKYDFGKGPAKWSFSFRSGVLN